ncbi:hypothetical protein NE172_07765 [Clostridium botulinum]|uniref:Uncharacterized protein n=1 Tax=Clostridium botulinum TaxID=1491 RepID=A0A6B4JLL9_CLOBO|nr:hypothetical protein [Clostridium botulinum]EES51033.1 conserved hypothetical protein [Clostridium botulinum E1 str. 'BoNT E Beluga']MBY6761055.1 hypothetical protein [Clostridium botulinum]MBY6919653.1 hypothetical protein [Clostridium botulinum]MCR1130849.1 hypothetical protein [Clostridium botulinum]NFH69466.1 hypothetical protein [Clostridium botulinum]
MSTYKPLATVISAAAINRYNGNKLNQSIGTTAWDLVLIDGLATGKSMHVSGSVVVSAPVILKSGTVLGWYGTTAGSIGNANIQTFTDSTGKYGVTVNTGSALTLKFYAHG